MRSSVGLVCLYPLGANGLRVDQYSAKKLKDAVECRVHSCRVPTYRYNIQTAFGDLNRAEILLSCEVNSHPFHIQSLAVI